MVITPHVPMWAAGYGHRTALSHGKAHDLHAKALAIGDSRGHLVVLVTCDLLGLTRQLSESVAVSVHRCLGLERGQIMFTASHTHCGPVLPGLLEGLLPMTPGDRAKAQAYARHLHDQLVELIAAALADLSPGRLSLGVGRASFAVNRRQRTPEGVIIGTNPNGPVDHQVPVLAATGANGLLRAMVVGYACHCTTLDINLWCGDYAGFTQLALEAAYPGATALFVAGCGADANPHPRRTLELCQSHGESLAGAALQAMHGPLTEVRGAISWAFDRVPLAFANVPSRDAFEREYAEGLQYYRERASRWLGVLDQGGQVPATYPYTIQAFRLGDNVVLLGLAGEVVAEYALSIRKHFPGFHVLPIAYANEVFGYLPTRRVLEEGGYEADLCMAVYGLPTTWSPSVEESIYRAACHQVERLLNGLDPPRADRSGTVGSSRSEGPDS